MGWKNREEINLEISGAAQEGICAPSVGPALLPCPAAEEVWQILFCRVLPLMGLFLPLLRFLAPVKDVAVGMLCQ